MWRSDFCYSLNTYPRNKGVIEVEEEEKISGGTANGHKNVEFVSETWGKPQNGHKNVEFVSETQEKHQNGHKNVEFVSETREKHQNGHKNVEFVSETQEKHQNGHKNVEFVSELHGGTIKRGGDPKTIPAKTVFIYGLSQPCNHKSEPIHR